MLGVAGPEPAVIAGVTGEDLALSTLECLAVQTGCSDPDVPLLLDRLHESDLPPAPVLLVTTHEGGLEEALGRGLHHPVACVNVADGSYRDFFEVHPSIADKGSELAQRAGAGERGPASGGRRAGGVSPLI